MVFPIYNLMAGIGLGTGVAIYALRAEAALPAAKQRSRATLLLLVVLPCALAGSLLFDRAVGVARGLSLPVGGLAFYGGFLGGLSAFCASCWALGLPLGVLADAIAPALAIGHGIGRVGCWLGGCCFGVAIQSPWLHDLGLSRVPTQLLEAAGCGAIGLGLLRWRPRTPGHVAWAYAGAYGALRFVLELWRADDRGHIFASGLAAHLSPSQWVAMLVLVALAARLALEKQAMRKGHAK